MGRDNVVRYPGAASGDFGRRSGLSEPREAVCPQTPAGAPRSGGEERKEGH